MCDISEYSVRLNGRLLPVHCVNTTPAVMACGTPPGIVDSAFVYGRQRLLEETKGTPTRVVDKASSSDLP